MLKNLGAKPSNWTEFCRWWWIFKGFFSHWPWSETHPFDVPKQILSQKKYSWIHSANIYEHMLCAGVWDREERAHWSRNKRNNRKTGSAEADSGGWQNFQHHGEPPGFWELRGDPECPGNDLCDRIWFTCWADNTSCFWEPRARWMLWGGHSELPCHILVLVRWPKIDKPSLYHLSP